MSYIDFQTHENRTWGLTRWNSSHCEAPPGSSPVGVCFFLPPLFVPWLWVEGFSAGLLKCTSLLKDCRETHPSKVKKRLGVCGKTRFTRQQSFCPILVLSENEVGYRTHCEVTLGTCLKRSDVLQESTEELWTLEILLFCVHYIPHLSCYDLLLLLTNLFREIVWLSRALLKNFRCQWKVPSMTEEQACVFVCELVGILSSHWPGADLRSPIKCAALVGRAKVMIDGWKVR